MKPYLMTQSVSLQGTMKEADAVLLFGPLDGHELRCDSPAVFVESAEFFHGYSRTSMLTASGRRIYLHDVVNRIE